MTLRAEGKNTFLGPALLLVAPGAAKRRVEAMLVQRVLQRLGFHHMGVQRGARCDRADAPSDAVLVDMNDQIEIEASRQIVAKPDHVAKFPGGIDMEQGKRQRRGMEGLDRQMQHDTGVFADRVQHDRVFELGDHLAHDFDCFGLDLFEVLRKHYIQLSQSTPADNIEQSPASVALDLFYNCNCDKFKDAIARRGAICGKV
jgi:hypothetical protein